MSLKYIPYKSYVRGGFSFAYFEAYIPVRENKNHENFVKPTFACFREV